MVHLFMFTSGKLLKMVLYQARLITYAFFFVCCVAGEKGYVREEFLNQKFACSIKERKLLMVKSEIQCVHHCLRQDSCGMLNVKDNFTGQPYVDNCEIYSLHANHSSCQILNGQTHWKAVIFERETKHVPVYKSCKEIFTSKINGGSRIYDLEDGKHFCRMDNISGCGTGGWTLVMKINGSKTTFTAKAEYWTSNDTYNTVNGLKSFGEEEAKFQGFSTISFQALCVGMKISGVITWIRIPLIHTSLQDVFQSGAYIATNIDRATWRGLIGAAASLQANCRRQGFNVKDAGGRLLTRIGYIANQENDCFTPDSFIGFGSTDDVFCISHMPSISCGNYAACSPDNGLKSIAAMGYILLQ